MNKAQIIQDYKISRKLEALMIKIREEEKREPTIDELLEDFLEYYESQSSAQDILEKISEPYPGARPAFLLFEIVYPVDNAEILDEPEEQVARNEQGQMIKGEKAVRLEAIQEITEDWGSDDRYPSPFTLINIPSATEDRIFRSPLSLEAFLRALEENGEEVIDVSRYR